MTSIIPNRLNGGLPVRDEHNTPIIQPDVQNAYNPDRNYDVTCELNYLPSDCRARMSPEQINGFQSEIIAFAEALTPNGKWDCSKLTNLSASFKQWVKDNLPDFSQYMQQSIYDPSGKATDAFSMGNMKETDLSKIMTLQERQSIKENTLAINEIKKLLSANRIPVGLEAWTHMSVPPEGWLAANGGLYSVEAYPELAKLYGTTFGGDGVNTFRVPDRRGYVPRGWDKGRGIDPERSLGSDQDDAIRDITGWFGEAVYSYDGITIYEHDTTGGAFGEGQHSTNKIRSLDKVPSVAFDNFNYPVGFYFKASHVVPTAPENRMKNFAALFIIKY